MRSEIFNDKLLNNGLFSFLQWLVNHLNCFFLNCDLSLWFMKREVAHIRILISDIYQEAGLPLWLHPYEVLVTSSYTALIETIHDTVILTDLLLPSEVLAS